MGKTAAFASNIRSSGNKPTTPSSTATAGVHLETRVISTSRPSREIMTATQAAPHDDVQQLERLVGAITRLRTQVAQRIVGQEDVVEGILTAVLAGGHALLIGVPGLAKTLMVQTVAEALNLTFNRVQF